jgi:hypothetical protein
VSNPDKVFWPDPGYTKLDLCSYYAAIAPHMLPFLRGRPLVLVRHPDGIAGKSFYQWNVPEGTPSWMRRLDISDTEDVDRTPKNVFLVDDDDGLVYLANLGCIPLHVLACRETSLGTCDFLTIDFDLGDRPFSDAVRLGLTLREVLDDVGLPGFPVMAFRSRPQSCSWSCSVGSSPRVIRKSLRWSAKSTSEEIAFMSTRGKPVRHARSSHRTRCVLIPARRSPHHSHGRSCTQASIHRASRSSRCRCGPRKSTIRCAVSTRQNPT